MMAKANQPLNGVGKKRGKERNRKKNQNKPPPPLIFHMRHNLKTLTIDPNLYVLVVARNCQQWAHAVVKMKNGQQQPNEIWRMAYAMLKGTTTEELREIKNNPLSLPEPKYVQTFDAFSNIEDNPKEFYEHYQ
ncbi:hypothetical protein G9A89_018044 [Geosiphon pyriformis]|nr:hypothetical protein G9A89_018044 [Geosiphon pyriformis]